jgi:hypothetical protein
MSTKLFADLHKKIETVKGKREVLEHALEAMQDCEAFDNNDKDMLSNAILTILQQEKKLKTELQKRMVIYNQEFVPLQKLCSVRDQVLNTQQKMLETFPTLASKFVGKQARLQKQLNELADTLGK